VSQLEFVKAMREFGLQASFDQVNTVFHSFDKDGSEMIDYRELHKLLVRSVQKYPRLDPLKARAENSIAIRKALVKGSNVVGEMAHIGKDEDLSESIPNQIRAALQSKLTRVVDLFKQLDEDKSGKVSVFEFIKSMRLLGLEAPPQAMVAVFNSIDKDKSGSIDYRELDRLLRNSVKTHPTLEEVKQPLMKPPSKGEFIPAGAGMKSLPQKSPSPSPPRK